MREPVRHDARWEARRRYLLTGWWAKAPETLLGLQDYVNKLLRHIPTMTLNAAVAEVTAGKVMLRLLDSETPPDSAPRLSRAYELRHVDEDGVEKTAIVGLPGPVEIDRMVDDAAERVAADPAPTDDVAWIDRVAATVAAVGGGQVLLLAGEADLAAAWRRHGQVESEG